MSTKHKDCRSARGGFSRCWAFKSSGLFAPHAACTRRLRKPSQPLNPGQRGPNVRATQASGQCPSPSERLFTDQAARCSLHAMERKFLLYTKAARRAARLLSNPAGLCLYDVAPDDGALLACAQLNQQVSVCCAVLRLEGLLPNLRQPRAVPIRLAPEQIEISAGRCGAPSLVQLRQEGNVFPAHQLHGFIAVHRF